jgi:hypothetical protein
MRAVVAFVFASILALVATAAPAHLEACSCPIPANAMKLPANQTALSIPADAKPVYVAVGVGVQNYTCSDAGTYVTAGAVADLWDISCLIKLGPLFDKVQDLAFGIYNKAKSPLLLQGIAQALPPLGHHIFILNADGSKSPLFDFTSSTQRSDAFIIAKKLGDISSPAGSTNVNWLELGNVSGGLANFVFRLDTKAGQPPASCTPGSPLISVKYTAKYWFFK